MNKRITLCVDKSKITLMCDLIHASYIHHGSGGALHCILDDGNIEDGFIHADIEYIKQYEDDPIWCEVYRLISIMLMELSEEDRQLLYLNDWYYTEEVNNGKNYRA